MIIEYEFTSQGNGSVRVYNDRKTASFTIPTHKYLPYAHNFSHVPTWHLTDDQKDRIETEVRAYTRANGNDQQKMIVFGEISVG